MRLPTQLTVLRIVLAAVFFVLFAIIEPPMTFWSVVVFVVASFTDWWDGHIARKMNLISPLGAFLDPLADKLLTGAAFVAFAWRDYIPWWMVIIVILRDAYLTGLRLAVDSEGLSVRTSYLAKVKTFVQMTFISIMLVAVLATEGDLGAGMRSIGQQIAAPSVLFWPMAIVTLLTAASALGYTYDNWSVLRSLTRRVLLRRPSQESI